MSGVIAAVISFILIRRADRRAVAKGERLVTSIWVKAAIFAGMGVIYGLCVCAVVGSSVHIPEVRQESDRKQLVTLVDSSSVSGGFFLASGSVGSERYYEYYLSTPDGGKQYAKVSAGTTRVYEEDRRDAYIANVSVEEKCDFSIFLHWWFCLNWGAGFSGYAIHVPKGTITSAGVYELDLK